MASPEPAKSQTSRKKSKSWLSKVGRRLLPRKRPYPTENYCAERLRSHFLSSDGEEESSCPASSADQARMHDGYDMHIEEYVPDDAGLPACSSIPDVVGLSVDVKTEKEVCVPDVAGLPLCSSAGALSLSADQGGENDVCLETHAQNDVQRGVVGSCDVDSGCQDPSQLVVPHLGGIGTCVPTLKKQRNPPRS